MTHPTNHTDSPPCGQSGTDAEPTRRQLVARASAAHTVTVRVVVSGFRFGGQDYRCRDELQIPADRVDTWLASGLVRLVEEVESGGHHVPRGVRELAEQFTENGR
ncbi:MAG: hypothetical protein ACRDQU_09875 [Pseudonocardiaceae bacterium]